MLKNVGDPVTEPKKVSDKIRACLDIFDKYDYLIDLPNQIKKLMVKVKLLDLSY